MNGFDHLNDSLTYATNAHRQYSDTLRGLEVTGIWIDEVGEIDDGVGPHIDDLMRAREDAAQAELEALPGFGSF